MPRTPRGQKPMQGRRDRRGAVLRIDEHARGCAARLGRAAAGASAHRRPQQKRSRADAQCRSDGERARCAAPQTCARIAAARRYRRWPSGAQSFRCRGHWAAASRCDVLWRSARWRGSARPCGGDIRLGTDTAHIGGARRKSQEQLAVLALRMRLCGSLPGSR